MSIDFARIKAIPISDVVGRYGVRLRFKGDWGSAVCPLPTHKQGDKEKNFTVNTKENYWKCFSASCNAAAGKKGGDCINFVALMDNCSQLDAAKKLADWFGIEKTASPIEKRPSDVPKGQPKEQEDNIPASGSVKTGYMASVGAWFDQFVVRRESESDADYLKRLKKGVLNQIFQSYKNGRSGREALST